MKDGIRGWNVRSLDVCMEVVKALQASMGRVCAQLAEHACGTSFRFESCARHACHSGG